MSPETSQNLLPALIAVPILGALLVFCAPARWRHFGGVLTSALVLGAAGFAAWGVATQGSQRHALGGWEAPLGIGLYLDGLSAVFVLMVAIIGFLVGLYASAFYAQPSEQSAGNGLFWPLWLFLWAGMNGIFLSADLFNLYVVIEVAGLAAVALAILSGKPPALIAGLRYLLAAVVGSMAYLMGVALIYGETGVLDLRLVADALEGGPTTRVALGLMLVGLMVKTALFPLHFWLPGAHSSAQAPVSAILSALVVKASFYLILRLWVDVFDASLTYAAGQVLGALGAMAVIWGSYQALRQKRLKLVIAHSTVGQIGFMFLLFPLITVAYDGGQAPWLAHAWTGGIYQALAHGFAKAAMFLAVGVYVVAVGNDEKDSMVDLVARLPMTTFALALAGVSLIGLPPSGGFVAKWMLLKAAFSSGQWWWAPVVVMGSFLTAGYVFMILRQAFAPAKESIKLRPVPRMMEVTALLLGIGSILIGFRAEEVLFLLDVDAPFEEPVEPAEGGGS
jgi:multicomponent Na+:H+ antiporter subunit D